MRAKGRDDRTLGPKGYLNFDTGFDETKGNEGIMMKCRRKFKARLFCGPVRDGGRVRIRRQD